MGHHGDLRLHTKSVRAPEGSGPVVVGRRSSLGLPVVFWWQTGLGMVLLEDWSCACLPMAPPSPWASLNPGLGEAG